MSQKRDYNITRLPSINKHNVYKNLNNYKAKTDQLSLQVNNYLVGRTKVKGRKQSRCNNFQIDQKQNNNKIISHRQKIINKLNQQISYKRHASIDIDFKYKDKNINILQDFQKKILKNKGYLRNQIIKRRSCKNSKRNIQPQSKLDGEIDQQKYKRKQQNFRNNLRKAITEQSIILQDFSSNIYNKMNYCNQQKSQIQNQNNSNKRDFLKKSEDFSKQIHSELFSNDIKNRIKINKIHQQQKIELKDFTNYYEWRRLYYNYIQNSIIYKVSTFEQQNQRLEQFRLRNQKSLQKYFQQKEKLDMRYSTKVRTLS